MNKTELRKKYKLLRNSLSNSEIETSSLQIANRLLSIPIWEKTYYHLFLSIIELKEVDTSFILHILQGKDKEVVVSKSFFGDTSMKHFLLTENTRIKKNNFHIPEPIEGIEVPVAKIDVVFVPLLAFDRKGHRIGYGKGFYDRFLNACRPETLKIGLSFFEAEDKITGSGLHDVALNYCVTPNKVYAFTENV
ncbi:5-formyltetrahydrofolate cyclo-ligase [Leptobacterium sp. I13]|uniref:5-formyltetrahydrofolate cyclo-ligase n=1 Tax=Leptobacterium meishanense TaxID=3128904 RepID=UPI0030ED3B68